MQANHESILIGRILCLEQNSSYLFNSTFCVLQSHPV